MTRQPPGSPGNSGPSDSTEGETGSRTAELVNRIVRGDREAAADARELGRQRVVGRVRARGGGREDERTEAEQQGSRDPKEGQGTRSLPR